MILRMLGCSHQNAPIAFRERLAFSAEHARQALAEFHARFPEVEAVLLSTCNRVELYTAVDDGDAPAAQTLVEFLAACHGLEPPAVAGHLQILDGPHAAGHLFSVAASLDSMVMGEPQILSQVKHAYQAATEENVVGPLLHAAFQAALKAARRVAGETTIHQRRVSIPSVAVADFAQQIFERFDDKSTLVLGAGEMAEETLRYLCDQGARDITVINRNPVRGKELADRWNGRSRPWAELVEALAAADLVVSTTGAAEPVVARELFRRVEALRDRRPLFVLDLAVPRDFETSIGDLPEVYLYSIDDLEQVCRRHRAERDKELPAARRIIDEETDRFLAELQHRTSRPVIRLLREGWQKPKEDELRRLFNKLPQLDERSRDEIRQSFDRLINKLLHPPLESLRDEARQGSPGTLVEALAKLFRLGE